MAETATVKVLAVSLKQSGFLPSTYNYQRSTSPYTSRSYLPYRLLLKVNHDGVIKYIYTPTTIVCETQGYLNYLSLVHNSSWIAVESSDLVSSTPAFDSAGPKYAIGSNDRLVPVIMPNDIITFSYVLKDKRITSMRLKLVVRNGKPVVFGSLKSTATLTESSPNRI